MTCSNKEINLSLNPVLYEAIERLAFIYNQPVQLFIEESLVFSVNNDIFNYQDEIGRKTCEKLKQLLEQGGIEVW